MTYINPYLSDEDTVRAHSVLSKRQAVKDYLAAKAEGGFDAALHDSKRPERPKVREGFRRPPGMSRSGAMDPQTKSRLEGAEARGEIEIQRNDYGEIEAYRPSPDAHEPGVKPGTGEE